MNKWKGEGKYYVWKVEAVERNRIMLNLSGFQGAEVFAGAWEYNGEGREAICDLKVVI